LLPADVPGEAHAAALQETTTAALGTLARARASATRSDAPGGAAFARAGRQAAQSPPGSWLLGPVEPLSAPVETRKVWWKMPGLGAAAFTVGSAR
jgi:hypothetical protein